MRYNAKIIMTKGEDGVSIEDISKSGSHEFTDTYSITLSNGEKFTFTVTNGRSVTSITKTGTDGLTDTYTITYNDGSSSTFTATNGKGITKIEKTGSSGLTDTYTITFNDGTSQTFTIKNGEKGQSSYDVATQSTNGLMSAQDKTKLDGLNVSTITNSEIDTILDS